MVTFDTAVVMEIGPARYNFQIPIGGHDRAADGMIFGSADCARHHAPGSARVQTALVRRPVPGHSNEIRIERLGLGKF
ncbi:hypothetical protein [Bradyrhizobium genosp. P]|uniref:hypothetical protein n=1 Tax=Bradyrhizobium genosp. P TaxID=83641 RepID=UPI003CF45150